MFLIYVMYDENVGKFLKEHNKYDSLSLYIYGKQKKTKENKRKQKKTKQDYIPFLVLSLACFGSFL